MSNLNLNTNWVDKFSGDPQSIEPISTGVTTIEEAVSRILSLSEISQAKLVDMLDQIKSAFGKSVIIYNPGVKSYDSALRKAKNETGEPNEILRLNDGYRASIICKNIEDIPSILDAIDALLPKYHFNKLSVLNTFDSPWPNGYRDYNCRLQDTENFNLVGELQIHFCPIKLFSQTVGHLSYEILRTLKDDDPCTQKVRDALQTIATAGYNSAMQLKDDCCFDKLDQLQSSTSSKGGKRKTSSRKKSKGQKHKSKRHRKFQKYKL